MFGYTIVDDEFVQHAFEHKRSLECILDRIPKILEKAGAEYVYNEPGSGDVTYELNGKTFGFNQSPYHFSGFLVNSQIVSFDVFILTILQSV